MITEEDHVYILGDLMLGDNEAGREKLARLHGRLHIIWGNHDTDPRKIIYATLPNVVETIGWAGMVHYKGYHFYLSHFPTLTGNLEKESLQRMTLNLFGHTHQKDSFYQDMPFMFHVGLDSNDNKPVSIETTIEKMNNKVKECINYL